MVDMNDLKVVWKIVTKNWWIPLVLLVVAYCASYLYSYKLTDVYAARTQILLKTNNEYNNSSLIGENFNTYYGGYQTYIDNSNEQRVIRSFDLIRKAVDKLKMDVSYFIVGRLRTTEVFEGMPYEVEVKSINPDLYEQNIKFRIVNVNEFEIQYSKAGTEISPKRYRFNTDCVDTDFNLRVIKNGAINANTIKDLSQIEYLVQIHDRNAIVYRFMSAMTVTNPEFTNILEVSVQDVLPQRAVVFLDTLSKVYIENTLKSRYDINQNTLVYINKQLEEVTEILNSIEDSMQFYKEDKAILSIDREENDYFGKLSDFDRQKSGLVLQIGALDALEKYIIEGKDPELLPPSAYINSNDDFLQKGVSTLYSLQLERNAALNTAKEGNAAIKQVDQKIELLKKNLLVYITNSRIAVREKIKDVEKEIAGYIGKIKQLPQKQRDLVNIQRKLNVNEAMYTFLLQKRANTIIAKAGIVPETKVIEAARSIGVVMPDKGKIRNNFLIGALVIAALIIFIRFIFFEKIESIDELKAKTHLPVLGEILFTQQSTDLGIAIENDPKSPVAESFRTIRTNLQYMAPQADCKVIVVTSNNPGEGKTFCSVNLSGILAKAGKKVLLLELDLHKPRVQKALKMESDKGISTVLINKHGIPEVIMPTTIDNLNVILSGPLPPNASELVLSPKLTEIIEYGRQHFDFIIIDTPPVGLISDALVLMQMSDIVLFVINTKFAHKESVTHAHEIAQNLKLQNFGFLLNGVKRKRSKYYYNKYAYGYGYGYGSYGGYGSGYTSGKS
jgi:capsular exopolysaccharide synthesis family protein